MCNCTMWELVACVSVRTMREVEQNFCHFGAYVLIE